jgi:two-component system OmpR family sensor kinase
MKLAAPRSLLGQYLLLHFAVALAATVVLVWSASALLHQTADHYQRDLLRQQAALSLAALGSGSKTVRPVVLTTGMATAVIGTDRRIRRAVGPARPGILATAPLYRTARFFRNGAVEGYSVPVAGGWIIVSQDDADPAVVTDDIVRTFLKRFMLVSLPIAALVPLIGGILARRLTLRMRAVSAIAATIGPRTLTTRLPAGLLPLEAEPLAEATNAALDRLAAAIELKTAFAADVAHELRTPLAVVRLRADRITEPELRGSLMAAVDRAARVITQLLALADLERPVEECGVSIDLHALAEDVVAERAPAILAGGRSIALDHVTGSAEVCGYRDAITLALENLIENAARHTAIGTTIVVQTSQGIGISVSDDGAPVPDETLLRLKDRRWRGTGARVAGSGIGLSIVERVARAHHGALVVHRGPGGRGLSFLLSLRDVTPAE